MKRADGSIWAWLVLVGMGQPGQRWICCRGRAQARRIAASSGGQTYVLKRSH